MVGVKKTGAPATLASSSALGTARKNKAEKRNRSKTDDPIEDKDAKRDIPSLDRDKGKRQKGTKGNVAAKNSLGKGEKGGQKKISKTEKLPNIVTSSENIDMPESTESDRTTLRGTKRRPRKVGKQRPDYFIAKGPEKNETELDEKDLELIERAKTCYEEANAIWNLAWQIICEKFYMFNGPKIVVYELRDTWRRLIQQQWMDEDFCNGSYLPAQVLTHDSPCLPLAFDSWSRGAIELLPDTKRESVMDPFLRDFANYLPSTFQSVDVLSHDEPNIESSFATQEKRAIEEEKYRKKSIRVAHTRRRSKFISDSVDSINLSEFEPSKSQSVSEDPARTQKKRTIHLHKSMEVNDIGSNARGAGVFKRFPESSLSEYIPWDWTNVSSTIFGKWSDSHMANAGGSNHELRLLSLEESSTNIADGYEDNIFDDPSKQLHVIHEAGQFTSQDDLLHLLSPTSLPRSLEILSPIPLASEDHKHVISKEHLDNESSEDTSREQPHQTTSRGSLSSGVVKEYYGSKQEYPDVSEHLEEKHIHTNKVDSDTTQTHQLTKKISQYALLDKHSEVFPQSESEVSVAVTKPEDFIKSLHTLGNKSMSHTDPIQRFLASLTIAHSNMTIFEEGIFKTSPSYFSSGDETLTEYSDMSFASSGGLTELDRYAAVDHNNIEGYDSDSSGSFHSSSSSFQSSFSSDSEPAFSP